MMLTFGPTMAHNALKIQVIIEEVTRHDGRFFVGEDLQHRKEMRTGLEALNTWIAQAQAGGRAKLYLTPKRVHDRTTRQEKWNAACNQAREGLEKMRSLQTDAELWLKKLTRRGNQNTEQLLTQISYLRIEDAQQTIDVASTIELPKGFGRD